MSLDALLARPGLPPRLRLMVASAVAIWRADWSMLTACATTARNAGHHRGDLEETLLQTVLFCGFPRVVTAFEQFAAAWPGAAATAGGELPLAARATAGRTLFDTIYGRNADSVDAMLRGLHPDFHTFVLDVAYGRILTRPHLTGRERELLAVGLLVAQEQVRQFAGHARGALHLGATQSELREVVVTTLGEVPAVDIWCARIR